MLTVCIAFVDACMLVCMLYVPSTHELHTAFDDALCFDCVYALNFIAFNDAREMYSVWRRFLLIKMFVDTRKFYTAFGDAFCLVCVFWTFTHLTAFNDAHTLHNIENFQFTFRASPQFICRF